MKLPLHVLTPLICLPSAMAITGPAMPARPAGKPAATENWKWTNPFTSRKLNRFTPACSAEKTFQASQFMLDDLQEEPPLGLAQYGDVLKTIFAGRPYPGSWDGIDPHGYDRVIVMMEYSKVPLAVREWIEDQEIHEKSGKGLFAVFQKPYADSDKAKDVVKFPPGGVLPAFRPLDVKKVVLFAPGALYEVLPLWVAEGSDCKETLTDISLYSPSPKDGGIIAWTPEHTDPDRGQSRRDMQFTIRAQVLKKKEEAASSSSEQSSSVRDEL